MSGEESPLIKTRVYALGRDSSLAIARFGMTIVSGSWLLEGPLSGGRSIRNRLQGTCNKRQDAVSTVLNWSSYRDILSLLLSALYPAFP